MDSMLTYLARLQDRVFKLLPLREEWDKGIDNHLGEYLENFLSDLRGAEIVYPALAGMGQFIFVRNNVAYLRDNPDIDFQVWRATVLRSTRLIGNAIEHENGSKAVNKK